MTERITVEIDLTENATYFVKDGELNILPPPQSGFGKHTIHWENEKVTLARNESTFRY